MNRAGMFATVIVSAIALIFGAMVYDRSRSIATESAELAVIAAEIVKQEERVIANAAALPSQYAPLTDTIARYHAASDGVEKRAKFQGVEITVQSALASGDPGNPAVRRLTDEIHGALNRRSKILPTYEAQAAKLREAQQGFLANVAQLF